MSVMNLQTNGFTKELSDVYNLLKETMNSLSLPNTMALREQVSDKINLQLTKIDQNFVELVTLHDRWLRLTHHASHITITITHHTSHSY